jgi:hypothetical protein
LRKIYREYGWPDTEKYQKEACIQAIIPWWTNMMDVGREEMRIENEKLLEEARTSFSPGAEHRRCGGGKL